MGVTQKKRRLSIAKVDSQTIYNQSQDKKAIKSENEPCAGEGRCESVDEDKDNTSDGQRLRKLLLPIHYLSLAGYEMTRDLAHIIKRWRRRNNHD